MRNLGDVVYETNRVIISQGRDLVHESSTSKGGDVWVRRNVFWRICIYGVDAKRMIEYTQRGRDSQIGEWVVDVVE